MKIDNLQNVFLLIADLFKNFRPPTTEAGIRTWLNLLGDVDVQTVVQAVQRVFAEEEFFSYAKLQEKIDLISKPQLPEPSEVVAEIRRLASNSQQPMGDKPEHIREVVRLMGGLPSIGRKQWDQWLEKDILRVYEEWKVTSSRRHDLERLTGVKSIGTEG